MIYTCTDLYRIWVNAECRRLFPSSLFILGQKNRIHKQQDHHHTQALPSRFFCAVRRNDFLLAIAIASDSTASRRRSTTTAIRATFDRARLLHDDRKFARRPRRSTTTAAVSITIAGTTAFSRCSRSRARTRLLNNNRQLARRRSPSPSRTPARTRLITRRRRRARNGAQHLRLAAAGVYDDKTGPVGRESDDFAGGER